MSVRARGKTRYVFSLGCLPKNTFVHNVKFGIIEHTNGKFTKIPKEINSKLFIPKEIEEKMQHLQLPILVCDNKKDIIDSLNRMIKHVKKANL